MIPPLRDAGETHAGTRRKYNEDSFIKRADLGLWAVADGAGGHQSGALASSTITAALDRLPTDLTIPDLLFQACKAVLTAHQALCTEAASRGPTVMIASTVVILIIRDHHYACLWAGDSRAYLLRAGILTQINHDHSLVQTLVDQGKISELQAEHHPQSNIITRAVGADNELFELEKVTGCTQSGDKFLLCSDGLSKVLTKTEITAFLDLPSKISYPKLLIADALNHGATDNVTAIVVEIL